MNKFTSLRSYRARMALSGLVAFALTGLTSAFGDAGDIGYQDQSYFDSATTNNPTDPTGTKRCESVVWFNDGYWWATMWDKVPTRGFKIFRLDTATQAWANTGVQTDARSTVRLDVLWDGAHLYVASHQFVAENAAAVATTAPAVNNLYRFSYNSATKTYSLDSGFPVAINTMKTQSLVIDKDSTGKLWATWQQGNAIYVACTQGSDLVWGTPFALPIALANNLTVNDKSSIVAFGWQQDRRDVEQPSGRQRRHVFRSS